MTTATRHERERTTSAAALRRPNPPATAAKPASTPHLPPRVAPRVSCVVPCLNEADNLAELLPVLTDFLAQRCPRWEIILVDDGSDDHTLEVIERWSGLAGVQALQLSRNFGKEAAITAGLEVADGDVVVVLDADMQHPPALIDTMLKRWRAGADVVYAVRQDRRDEGWFKQLGARVFYGLMNAGDRFAVPPDAGDFRLMDRAVVDALLSLPERNRFMKGLYAWVGFRAEAVGYVPAQRANGHSKFGALRLIGLSIDGLTSFTRWPLRLASLAGICLASMALLYGAYLSIVYLAFGHAVSGWTTIVVSLMLFAGIQMISMGILGEYVGRIFEEVKARPKYIVKRRIGARFEEDRS